MKFKFFNILFVISLLFMVSCHSNNDNGNKISAINNMNKIVSLSPDIGQVVKGKQVDYYDNSDGQFCIKHKNICKLNLNINHEYIRQLLNSKQYDKGAVVVKITPVNQHIKQKLINITNNNIEIEGANQKQDQHYDVNFEIPANPQFGDRVMFKVELIVNGESIVQNTNLSLEIATRSVTALSFDAEPYGKDDIGNMIVEGKSNNVQDSFQVCASNKGINNPGLQNVENCCQCDMASSNSCKCTIQSAFMVSSYADSRKDFGIYVLNDKLQPTDDYGSKILHKAPRIKDQPPETKPTLEINPKDNHLDKQHPVKLVVNFKNDATVVTQPVEVKMITNPSNIEGISIEPESFALDNKSSSQTVEISVKPDSNFKGVIPKFNVVATAKPEQANSSDPVDVINDDAKAMSLTDNEGHTVSEIKLEGLDVIHLRLGQPININNLENVAIKTDAEDKIKIDKSVDLESHQIELTIGVQPEAGKSSFQFTLFADEQDKTILINDNNIINGDYKSLGFRIIPEVKPIKVNTEANAGYNQYFIQLLHDKLLSYSYLKLQAQDQLSSDCSSLIVRKVSTDSDGNFIVGEICSIGDKISPNYRPCVCTADDSNCLFNITSSYHTAGQSCRIDAFYSYMLAGNLNSSLVASHTIVGVKGLDPLHIQVVGDLMNPNKIETCNSDQSNDICDMNSNYCTIPTLNNPNTFNVNSLFCEGNKLNRSNFGFSSDNNEYIIYNYPGQNQLESTDEVNINIPQTDFIMGWADNSIAPLQPVWGSNICNSNSMYVLNLGCSIFNSPYLGVVGPAFIPEAAIRINHNNDRDQVIINDNNFNINSKWADIKQPENIAINNHTIQGLDSEIGVKLNISH